VAITATPLDASCAGAAAETAVHSVVVISTRRKQLDVIGYKVLKINILL
jgi:hypothetical protein